MSESETGVLMMAGKSESVKGGWWFVTDEKWALREVMLKWARQRARGSGFFKVPIERRCHQCLPEESSDNCLEMHMPIRSEKVWVGWDNCDILNQEIAVFLKILMTWENMCPSQENFLNFSWVRKIFDQSQENGYFLIQDITITSTRSYFSLRVEKMLTCTIFVVSPILIY